MEIRILYHISWLLKADNELNKMKLKTVKVKVIMFGDQVWPGL